MPSVVGSIGKQFIISGRNLYRAIPRDRATFMAAHRQKMSIFKEAGFYGVARDIAATAYYLGKSCVDLITFLVPKFIKTKNTSFGFLVHPRDIRDIWTCYPFFHYLPDSLVMEIAHLLPPRVISHIDGVTSNRTGKSINGYLLAAFVAPQHIIENPTLAVMRVVQSAHLARKRGIAILGLGALVPFLTKYGKIIKKYVPGIGVTTGHAFTAYCIAQTTLQVIRNIGSTPEHELVAVLGAAGSTGSASTWSLAESNVKKLLLIDRDIKIDALTQLKQQLEDAFPGIEISLSVNNNDILKSRIIITVTNAGESIVQETMLRPGTIFIDDAQPPNVSQELATRRKDILVIKVLVHVPGLNSNFDYRLGTAPDITFTCLGEIALLASLGWVGDHTIGYADREQVKQIISLAKGSAIGLPSPLYGYDGIEITPEMIGNVGSLWQE